MSRWAPATVALVLLSSGSVEAEPEVFERPRVVEPVEPTEPPPTVAQPRRPGSVLERLEPEITDRPLTRVPPRLQPVEISSEITGPLLVGQPLVLRAAVPTRGDFWFDIDWGDGTPALHLRSRYGTTWKKGQPQVTARHTYSEAKTYQVHISAIDEQERGRGDSTIQLEIEPRPSLGVSLGGDDDAAVGDPITLTIDVEEATETVVLRVDWGDRRTSGPLEPSAWPFDITHVYAREGPYEIEVVAVDTERRLEETRARRVWIDPRAPTTPGEGSTDGPEPGGSEADDDQEPSEPPPGLDVVDAPAPHLDIPLDIHLDVPPRGIVNEPVPLHVEIPGDHGRLDLTVSWGDGTPSTRLGARPWMIEHRYTAPGRYDVEVTAVDPRTGELRRIHRSIDVTRDERPFLWWILGGVLAVLGAGVGMGLWRLFHRPPPPEPAEPPEPRERRGRRIPPRLDLRPVPSPPRLTVGKPSVGPALSLRPVPAHPHIEVKSS